MKISSTSKGEGLRRCVGVGGGGHFPATTLWVLVQRGALLVAIPRMHALPGFQRECNHMYGHGK